MTPHNEAKVGDIAKTVLMPGDPLRAKYIAENYLKNVKKVNSIRNMYSYTGMYKNTEVTIFPSGMGMPSIGIYAYELYNFYNVENIIRIGSCGALIPELNLLDLVLVNKSYTSGNFSLALTGEEKHFEESSKNLNDLILQVSKNSDIKLTIGDTCCSEIFADYCKPEAFEKRMPKNHKLIASEMEAFALFSIANFFHKHSACLLTVVDSIFSKDHITSKDREILLNNMISLALDTTTNIT